MIRRSFRAPVDLPRPVAAIGLVGVASATLALTGQVTSASVALQATLLLLALLLRERPQAVQRSALFLNCALLAIVTLALALALRGAPTLVALAHFAMLASGLQLLDARPRRSEFLLVALALFEVILASNLTDSLVFAPLLAIFLPTAVWTLIVHTLRTEAIEAGDPEAATRALSRGLLSTTALASAASLVLALALFLLLPRMQAGIGRNPLLGSPFARAGFSDEVELGAFGRIHGDARTALRVRTLAGRDDAPGDGYWRGLAFDRFDGRRWSLSSARRSPVAPDAELGVERPGVAPAADRVEEIVRESTAGGVLFAGGRWARIEGPVGRLEQDAAGSLYAPTRADVRVRYVVSSTIATRDARALRDDHATLPPGASGMLLELPQLDDEIARLARDAARDATTDAERALALEHWLRTHGRYTDTPPAPEPDDSRAPLERFLLGERAGHCEYFASAFVVMARALGLPARLVNGYAGGRVNAIGGFVELTESDAHAWAEVHFARAGWVRFDGTPPDLRLAAHVRLGMLEQLEEIGSALELWWFDRVVDFDRVDQMHAIVGFARALRALRFPGLDRDEHPQPSPASDGPGTLPPIAKLAFAVAGICGLALAASRLHRRRDGATLAPRVYVRSLRLLARSGFVRDPATPPRAFAREVAPRLSPDAAAALRSLTEAYLAARYGGRSSDALGAAFIRLRDSLRS